MIRKMLVAVIMLCGGFITAQGAAIEHVGENYVINVDELGLTGEETLSEVLAMFGDVIGFDNQGASSIARTNDYMLSVHNMGYSGDVEQYLAKTKAKEVEQILVFNMSGTMKGVEGLDKVIDVYYKKGADGTSGRVSVKADSYGELTTFNTVRVERKDFTLWGQAMGGLKHRKVNGMATHASEEAAVAGMKWQINDNNMLTAQLQQSFSKSQLREEGMREFTRYVDLNIIYDATLSERGATMEIQTVLAHTGSNAIMDGYGTSFDQKATVPVGVAEFFIPLYKDKLSVIAGVEGGLSIDDMRMQDYVNRQLYYDLYGEIDWNIHGLNVSIGDRVRTNKYYQNENHGASEHKSSHRNHFFNVSMYGNITKNAMLKGSFAKAPLSPSYYEFLYREDETQEHFNYLSSVRRMDAYISELRYEYQKPDFRLTAFVNNSHTNYFYHSNTFQVGASTYWHKGVLRLTTALNYYNIKGSITEEMHSNVVQVRLQPMLALQAGWQIVPQLTYSSYVSLGSESIPAQLSAHLRVSKSIGKWDFDLIGGNLAHQRYGRRSVALGVTYNW